MQWDIEVTDTFGGEANYCWVRRETLELPSGLSDRAIVRRAKRAVGLTGVRCETERHGDGFEIRPRGACVVCFAMPRY